MQTPRLHRNNLMEFVCTPKETTVHNATTMEHCVILNVFAIQVTLVKPVLSKKCARTTASTEAHVQWVCVTASPGSPVLIALLCCRAHRTALGMEFAGMDGARVMQGLRETIAQTQNPVGS